MSYKNVPAIKNRGGRPNIHMIEPPMSPLAKKAFLDAIKAATPRLNGIKFKLPLITGTK